MWGRLTLGTRIALACLLSSGAVEAEAPETASDAIGFEEAIARTLDSNPRLVAFGYQFAVREGNLQQAGLALNPELNVMVENVAGTGAFSGLDQSESTLTLAWYLERGKREGRIDVQRAGLSLLELDAAIQRLDAVARTARLYMDSFANQLLIETSIEGVKVAEDTVTAVRERVEAGRSPAAELARAEARLAEQLLIREDYEHRLRTSLRQLAAQWGQTDPAFTRVAASRPAIPEPIAYEPLIAQLDENQELRRFVSERRLREAELRLAETRARPNWRIGASVRHFEVSGDQAFVADITIPLATRNKNQGQIAAARAALEANAAERHAARIDLETRLFALYQEFLHSLHVAESLRDDVLPKVETALRETRRAYEAGRYGYLELTNAQDEALSVRTATVLAAVDANRNLIEIERLTGTAITAPAIARGGEQ
jgi:cobalt-zinc-cadmium efflux system outer membrane protein